MTLSEVSVFIEPQHALRKLYTRRASFGRSLIDRINPATGRVHGSLILYGAKTGRFASSEPNLQNRPRPRFDNAGREVENVRRSWVAPPGRVIVAADEGQAELRTAATIAAGISRHSAMRDSIAAGVDVHKRNAAAINGIAESAVTKAQRQTGKAVWFGLLYGQSARGLRQFAYASYGVDMTHHEAENARSTFFRLYPELYLLATPTSARERSSRLRDDRWRTVASMAVGIAAELPLQRGVELPDQRRRCRDRTSCVDPYRPRSSTATR